MPQYLVYNAPSKWNKDTSEDIELSDRRTKMVFFLSFLVSPTLKYLLMNFIRVT